MRVYRLLTRCGVNAAITVSKCLYGMRRFV